MDFRALYKHKKWNILKHGFNSKTKLKHQLKINPFLPNLSVVDFTLSNAGRFYLSKEGPLRVKGLNKCFQKFCLSVRKRDGNFYNKKSFTGKEHRAAWFSLFSADHLLHFLEIKQIFNRPIIQLVWHIIHQLLTSVSVRVVDIYLASSRLGKYPPLITHTEVNNC